MVERNIDVGEKDKSLGVARIQLYYTKTYMKKQIKINLLIEKKTICHKTNLVILVACRQHDAITIQDTQSSNIYIFPCFNGV